MSSRRSGRQPVTVGRSPARNGRVQFARAGLQGVLTLPATIRVYRSPDGIARCISRVRSDSSLGAALGRVLGASRPSSDSVLPEGLQRWRLGFPGDGLDPRAKGVESIPDLGLVSAAKIDARDERNVGVRAGMIENQSNDVWRCPQQRASCGSSATKVTGLEVGERIRGHSLHPLANSGHDFERVGVEGPEPLPLALAAVRIAIA